MDNDDPEFDANFKLEVLRERASFFTGPDNAPMTPRPQNKSSQ